MSLNNEKTLCEILPGFYLVEGQWSGEDILGLTHFGNHPEILFKRNEIVPPLSPLSDNFDNDLMYFSAVEALEKKFKVDAMYGYDLIKAAKKSGYRPDRHGKRFMCWFMDKLYAALNPEYLEKIHLEKKVDTTNELKNLSKRKLKV